MLHPEALFLVEHEKPQLPELDVARKQAVGADDEIDFSFA